MKSQSNIVIALAAILLLAGCDEEEVAEVKIEPRPVQAIPVDARSALGQRAFSGRARPAREAELSFRVGGRLSKRRVDVGDIVEAGDLIAELDTSTFQADVARLEADLAAAQADFRAKDQQHERIMTLVNSGTYSEARGDQAAGIRDSAASVVKSVRSALERAKLDLSYTTLAAPYPGRVVRVSAEDFEDVRAQQEIVRLLDISAVEMVIDVPETLIPLAPLVETLTVTFDAFPDVDLIATVKEIGAEASATTRTFPVTLRMEQPEDVEILPGMAGSAIVRTARDVDLTMRLILPTTAVRPMSDGGDDFAVWVVDPDTSTVSLRPVALGSLLNDGYEVTGGLKSGEWVVTAGIFSLTEGQKVQLPPSGDAVSEARAETLPPAQPGTGTEPTQ